KTYHGTPVQCPVFQIELEGKTMVICNRCYTNTNKISQGDVVELHVNPDHPKEYYIEKRKDMMGIGLALFGGMIIVIMAFSFYFINFCIN
ncbi:MAG: hypothetical protein J5546_10955, partial [Lachnospiraceae bacterium]|nr:hypothetical protein [Lachnospiraceae bacterium]